MGSRKVKLTPRLVESESPEGKPYEVRDTVLSGLLLRVQPSGVRSYVYEWRRGKRRTLGRHPVMTVDQARRKATIYAGEAAEHGAPLNVIEAAQAAPAVRTFGEYMRDRYGPHLLATAKAGKATIACIEAQFGHLYETDLADISRSDFDTFKAARLKAGKHPATVNRDLDRLKAALSTAVGWDLLQVNPLLGVKRIKRDIEERVRYLSPKEETRLRTALDVREAKFKRRRESANRWRVARHQEPLPEIEGYADHVMPMALMALNTGLRRGEITQLRWTDIDLAGKRLTVRAGYAKSGKLRHVPLNSEALAVMKRYAKQHKGKGELFGLSCLAKSWGRLMTAAKIEDFRFHDLRHTFASKLVMAGIDLNTVRELLGHGDIKMTLRYAHLAPEHKAAAVETLVRKRARSEP